MIIENIKLVLPEGDFNTTVYKFEESDKKHIKDMIVIWNNLSQKLKQIKARGINIPEGISEPLYCLVANNKEVVRTTRSISGANSSFDCYNIRTKERIQVKACSVLPDLSSFGPKSKYDKLIFMDLSNIALGDFRIFDISVDLIDEHKVNKKQTFLEQQQQQRRPRFSIAKIIAINNIKPCIVGNINDW
jgi:hypothetical protein